MCRWLFRVGLLILELLVVRLLRVGLALFKLLGLVRTLLLRVALLVVVGSRRV
jgi:hypothetical protein